MLLYEKYRPKAWGEVIAQDAVLDIIARHRHDGLGGKAYWITGQRGTGKTTIARLLAAEVASPWCTESREAGQVSCADIAAMLHKTRLYGMGKGGWAFIINEAHGIRKDTMRALLEALEPIASCCCWIFTTPCDGQQELFADEADAPTLLSRCVVLNLARRDIARPFAERCKTIAATEGLDGQPIARYIRLMQKCHNNLRAAIQAVQNGEMVTG